MEEVRLSLAVWHFACNSEEISYFITHLPTIFKLACHWPTAHPITSAKMAPASRCAGLTRTVAL